MLDSGESAFEFVENSTHSVTITLTEQVLTTAGHVPLLVSFMVGDEILSTFSIILDVSENPGIDVAESEDYFSLSVAIDAAKKVVGDTLDPNAFASKEYVENIATDIRNEISNVKDDAKVFYVTISQAEDGSFSADKPSNVVQAAYSVGRVVKAIVQDDGENIAIPLIGIVEGNTALYAGYGAYGKYIVVSQTGKQVFVRFEEFLTDDDIKNLNPENIGAIPAPNFAKVGQTVVVKELDDNGKPTAWETADLSAPKEAVLYTPQDLTPEQKAQARDNIGAGGGYIVDTLIDTVLTEEADTMRVDFAEPRAYARFIIRVEIAPNEAGTTPKYFIFKVNADPIWFTNYAGYVMTNSPSHTWRNLIVDITSAKSMFIASCWTGQQAEMAHQANFMFGVGSDAYKLGDKANYVALNFDGTYGVGSVIKVWGVRYDG